MNAWVTILVVVIGPAISSVMGNMIYHYYRKPEDLNEKIVAISTRLAYVEGELSRINGKH